jgi:hypothetical protein
VKTRTKISRPRIAGLLLSLTLLVLALIARHRGWLVAPAAGEDLDALKRQRTQLSIHDDNTLIRLRHEVAAQRASTPTTPNELIASARGQLVASSDARTQRVTLRTTAAVPRWTEIVATVDRLEHQPGWRVVSFDLRSRGSRQHREISGVEIVLERASATPGRPAVGPVSPGSAVPARPRKTGRSSSLRRPSAGADRLRRPAPTPGPDFALFRVRPSGLGRLSFHPSLHHHLNHNHP